MSLSTVLISLPDGGKAFIAAKHKQDEKQENKNKNKIFWRVLFLFVYTGIP